MSFKNGFVLGALVGGVVGLLFAPRPGRQSRERFKVFRSEFPARAEDFMATAQEAAKDVKTVWSSFAAEKKQEVRDAIDEGRAAQKQAEADLHKEYTGRAATAASTPSGSTIPHRPTPTISTADGMTSSSLPANPAPYTSPNLGKNGDSGPSKN